jgi:MoaA/NifB/PqqE/SkfB family radical SAM enzyme
MISKLYIEPTNRCNLDCRTCMRNSWDEPMGQMDHEIYDRILAEVAELPTPPTIFFGGIGEPLSHPHIVDMVARAKKIAARVEMITNGILLSEGMAMALIQAGLDCLWVSIDGAHPESYLDVRLGDHLPEIIDNLHHWQQLSGGRTDLGITFVAMKRNQKDLPAVVQLAKKLGARRFSISNVEAYTPDLLEERLYQESVSIDIPEGGCHPPRFDEGTIDPGLLEDITTSFILPEPRLLPAKGGCPFSLRSSLSIRWDGSVGPCLPLLHSHTVHFKDYERHWPAFFHGSLQENSLATISQDEAFIDFHQRLQDFSGFGPCLSCNGCDLPSVNGEDCYGNFHPACGGCLWAQGFVVCP